MARKILLADDSVTAQNMGRKILADAGYEVITVNNGSAALKKVTEHKPDLIVLDVYMPGYSGLEVCQRLKEAGDTSRIPILLTVGKLEPFKPEEARRVRADAFIVKPFEASELLSALSKLEDKVVPRSESSKPGRFARATAAIDERFDRSMAVEEDSSWKNRIAFPKKKEKELEQDVDDPAVYNPVNKDLRTVVAHKPEEHPKVKQPEPEEERVNLAALAPEGLPKDVTPEEIAALAAAAAQVKGKIAEESLPELKASENVGETAAVEPVQSAEVKAETKSEVKEETPPAEIPAPVAASASVPEQEKSEEKPKEAEKAKEAEIVPSASEVTAAISELEQKSAEEAKDSGSTTWTEAAKSEEPVTMAAAAAAGANGSRWTAVAVALSSEEASISLEQEMQKAASFAVGAERVETAATNSAAITATVAMVEAPTPAEVSEAPQVEASVAALPVVEAPVVQETSSFADAPSAGKVSSDSEDVSAAAISDSTAATPSIPESGVREQVSSTSAEVEPVAASTTEPDSAAEASEPVVAEAVKAEIEPVESQAPETVSSSAEQTSTQESPEVQPNAEMQVSAPEAAVSTDSFGTAEFAPKEEMEESPAPHSATRTAGGTDEGSKKESDMTASTAAAWASWRKIRETGVKPEKEENPELKDEAARAVAAGAESNPEEVSELDSDPEIANIVDSVLADMRPKIVQEIAKKLGKKK